MISRIEPSLYLDPQQRRPVARCPRCGWELYAPGAVCPRCQEAKS